MKKLLFVLITLSVTGILACKKNVVEPQVNNSSKYFAMELGSKYTYQMDSITFSSLRPTPDTFKYQIQDVITDQFIDNEGTTTFRIERYYKYDSASTWTFSRNYSQSATLIEAIRTDFDIPQIVMSMPVLQDKLWDGNQYNTKDQADFFYEYVHKADSIGNKGYDSTCLVFQDESTNFIQSIFVKEKYAANIGLVYREQEKINNLGTNDQLGFKFKLTLIDFER